MEIVGTVVLVNDTQVVSDRFRKRVIVIDNTTDPQYPSPVSVEFVQDRVDLLDGYQPGQRVKAWFDLRGRKWDGPQGTRYFTTVQGWRIQSEEAQQPQAGGYADVNMGNIPPVPPAPAQPGHGGGQVDDIPF